MRGACGAIFLEVEAILPSTEHFDGFEELARGEAASRLGLPDQALEVEISTKAISFSVAAMSFIGSYR